MAPRPDDFRDTVGNKAARKRRARGQRDEVWFWLGMFGLVGWAVAVPTVAGVFLGRWIDDRVDGGVSWTLTLLLVGVALGCLNAWYWIRQQIDRRR